MKDLLKTYFLFFLFGLLFSCTEDNSNADLIKHTSISRSLALLNNSTAEHPSSIYILFYGQSIVKGMKSDRIVDSLKKVFPSADIVHSNMAIGGFTAPSLLKTAERLFFMKLIE